ncbi:MAG: hypothetical protein LBG65_02835 [Puniceicoccales bacterium]|nr:hypothetical protein [Puniceicoccales bacterium]
MKKFIPLFALPTAAILLGGGCQATNQAGHSAGIKATTAVIFQPDVEVGKKVSGEATVTEILGFIQIGADKQANGVNYGLQGAGATSIISSIFGEGGIDKAKAAAAYVAITSNPNTDLLVAPTYIVSTEDFVVFKRHTARVSALQGTIRKVRQEKFDGKNINTLQF